VAMSYEQLSLFPKRRPKPFRTVPVGERGTVLTRAMRIAAISASSFALSMSVATHAFAADVLETAQKAGTFKTLVAAVEAAGLTATLKGKGPYTIFAPSDEAFAKLPKEQFEALLKDKAALAKLLSAHVVPDKLMAADLKAGALQAADGSALQVATQGGVTVSGARVTQADVTADNGVIHVIDTVILPK
jgi:uncharacterized surface protein with fasciclin (FAS1) repeats